MAVIHVVGAVIASHGRCLIAQRGPRQKLAGKWEFPGGKIEAGEAPDVALAREIHEELGLVIAVGELLGTADVATQFGRILLSVYAATTLAGVLHLAEHAQVAWVTAVELTNFDWSEADVPLIAPVATWLREQL